MGYSPGSQSWLQFPHLPLMYCPRWSRLVLHQGSPLLSAVVQAEYSMPLYEKGKTQASAVASVLQTGRAEWEEEARMMISRSRALMARAAGTRAHRLFLLRLPKLT